jgi:hypothetical protein
MINNFLIFFIFLLSGLVLFLTAFNFFGKKNPVSKIIVSGFIFILITICTTTLTVMFDYDLSGFIDIIVIYFILGFSSFVLYFVFFNKRT